MAGNIRQFENPIQGLRPDNGAEQVVARAAAHIDDEYSRAGAALGSGIGAFGRAYTEVKERQEISQGMSTHAEIMDNLTTAWQATINSADPNDHSVAEKFREEQLKPILDAWTTSFQTENGKKWADLQSGNLQQHFFEKTSADQALKAGEATISNYQNLVRSASSTAFQDPSDHTLNVTLGMLDTATDVLAASPYLTPEMSAKVRSELNVSRQEVVKSHLEGAARINPDAAMAAIASGKYANLISGDDQNHAFALAESYKRSQQEDSIRAVTAARQADKADAQQAMTSLYAEGIGKGAAGTWSPPPNYSQRLQDIIRAHPQGVDMAEAHAASNMVTTFTEDQTNGRLVQSDPHVFNSFLQRSEIMPGQPGALTRAEVYQAAAERRLSNHDASTLSQSIESANDPSERELQKSLNTFIQSKKAIVLGNKGFGAFPPTPEQQERFYQFQVAMKGAVAAYRTAHPDKSPGDAAHELLDPASKHYLGRLDTSWMHYYTTGESVVNQIPGRPAAAAAPPAAQGTPPAVAAAQGKRPSLDDLAKQNGLP
jgi:hypothetical protein